MKVNTDMHYAHTQTRLTLRWYSHCALIVATVIALIGGASSAQALAQVAQADLGAKIADERQAREYAVEMVSTSFPASQAAAEAVLRGGPEELAAYAASGMDEARRQDLRNIVVTIASLSGEHVQRAAQEALDADDIGAISAFVESGWQAAQHQDDRATAWRAAQAPAGSALKAAADRALAADTEEALGEFASTGEDKARREDERKEVYELSRSPLPSVAAGASEALIVDTDTAIEAYLRYGQFVDASQDAEKMSITQLVDTAIAESAKAQQEAVYAATNADQARRATEAARQATLRAKDEALAADAAQVRAGNAAAAAGKLATQSAHAADKAVAAAAEARQALAQTADALSRAASAASRARIAAQEASARASAAGYDASMAAQARRAAEQARDAARAADRAAQAFTHADSAAQSARNASGAAASAAGNADAAAAAASEAASAAGVSEQAAADARAGAARARAAASRARAASNEVDGLVNRIAGLVAEARTAAKQAAEHANNSARAAEDAAREAGNAAEAAKRAGVNAQAAQDAAAKSIDAINLAGEIARIGKEAANLRQEQEAQYLQDQATQAREIEDERDRVLREQQENKNRLLADLNELAELETHPDQPLDFTRVQQLTVSAARVGDAMVQGGAKVALQTGSHEDLAAFTAAFSSLKYQDDLNKVQFLWQNDPNPEIRAAADEHVEDPPEQLAEFLSVTVANMRIPGLTERAWQLHDAGGQIVQQHATEAITAGTFEALNAFVNEGGFEKARYEDQTRQAYELARTGGPELKASAEAAVLGDRKILNEFINIEAFRKSADDAQRAAHDNNIDALLQKGQSAAQSAAESAAKAQNSYFTAYGNAAKAAEYSRQAADWAGKASQSAQTAQGHVKSAQESLNFALAQQERAHAAAQQAESDARQAAANADIASSYALQARQSAIDAAHSAAQARQSANAAGSDAQLAGQAAQEAYDAAIQKQLAEEAELQEASMAGAGDNPQVSVLDAIKETIGNEALDLLLDFIGVTDIINCFKGEVSACLWTALNFVPGGAVLKFGKAAKALPALRSLLSKLPDVKKLISAKKQHKADRLAAGLKKPGGCVASHASNHQVPAYSFAVHQKEAGGGEVQFQPAVSWCKTHPGPFHYYDLNVTSFDEHELNVYMKWDKRSELSSIKPGDVNAFGYQSNEDQIAAAIKSLGEKIESSKSTIKLSSPDRRNDIELRPAPKALDLRQRKVGRTDAQNKFAQTLAILAEKRGSTPRIDQRDASYILDPATGKAELQVTSRGRPDLNDVRPGQKSIKTELESPGSPRGIGHVEQQLDADPEAEVWLLTLGPLDPNNHRESKLLKVIEQNRRDVENYVP